MLCLEISYGLNSGRIYSGTYTTVDSEFSSECTWAKIKVIKCHLLHDFQKCSNAEYSLLIVVLFVSHPVRSICKSMGMTALHRGRLGSALSWGLRSKDVGFATFLAER